MEKPSKQNQNTMCRWLRICIGIALIALGTLVVEGTIGTVLIILGILALISGIIGFCPCSTICKPSTEGGSCCCFGQRKTDQPDNQPND
jgi:hypothetical protein